MRPFPRDQEESIKDCAAAEAWVTEGNGRTVLVESEYCEARELAGIFCTAATRGSIWLKA
jgi:hypothetical protein